MFCPFCGVSFSHITPFCASCGRSLDPLRDTDQTEGSSAQETSELQLENSKRAKQSRPSYKRSSKSKERQSFNRGLKVRRKRQSKPVQINIGLMVTQGTDLKPLRGKTLPLFTSPEITAQDLLTQAVQKMRTIIKDVEEEPNVLLYPDCTEVINVPGTDTPFRLADYKKEIGKSYARITLFICPESNFKQGLTTEDDTSDSGSGVVMASKSRARVNQADTVVFETHDQRTPDNKSFEKETVAPCDEEEDEELVEVASSNVQPTAINDTEAKLERYKRKRRKNEPPCRSIKTEPQSTPTSNDSERKPAADLHTEATVPKAVHDDLKQMYSQLNTQCDSLRVEINKLKAENEQFKTMVRALCHYSPE